MDDHTRDPTVAPPRDDRWPTRWLPDEGRWVYDTLRRATRHGVVLYNADDYHAAHDYFEPGWPTGTKPYCQGSGFERPATSL
jgi:hypothetical protein